MKNNYDRQISVIVPVYNCEKYLDRCLKSLVNQTYNNLQIILIDDGATDGSGKICDTYASQDQRICVIHQENGGVGKARNTGLEIASGDFIAFVDSDDWVHSKYFETLVYYQEKCNADVVMCRSDEVKEFKKEDMIDVSSIQHRDLSLKEILSHTIAKTRVWARLYRKSLLENIKFPEKINLGEDTCYNLSAIVFYDTCKCVIVEQAMYYYFVARNDSLVHTANYNDILTVALWYMEQMKLFKENKEVYEIWCDEACKSLLACRYLNTFNVDKKVYAECNQYLRSCLAMMKKRKNKKMFRFTVLYRVPLLYRLYRIYTDRTMLVWEKAQKANRKK